MSIELIKKLVRLANNNKNDNEANLAARKACRMIAELNFILDQQPNTNYYKPITYNDVQRSTEPEFRYRNPFEGFGTNPDADWIRNWYNRVANDKKEADEKVRQAREKEQYQKKKSYYENLRNEYMKDPWKNDVNYGQATEEPLKKDKKVKRKLKCKVCDKTVETIFIGAAELFECNDCQWTAYNKKKGFDWL